jgi:hypothetical protein
VTELEEEMLVVATGLGYAVRLVVGYLVYAGGDLRSNRRPGTTSGASRRVNDGRLLDHNPGIAPLKR